LLLSLSSLSQFLPFFVFIFHSASASNSTAFTSTASTASLAATPHPSPCRQPSFWGFQPTLPSSGGDCSIWRSLWSSHGRSGTASGPTLITYGSGTRTALALTEVVLCTTSVDVTPPRPGFRKRRMVAGGYEGLRKSNGWSGRPRNGIHGRLNQCKRRKTPSSARHIPHSFHQPLSINLQLNFYFYFYSHRHFIMWTIHVKHLACRNFKRHLVGTCKQGMRGLPAATCAAKHCYCSMHIYRRFLLQIQIFQS